MFYWSFCSTIRSFLLSSKIIKQNNNNKGQSIEEKDLNLTDFAENWAVETERGRRSPKIERPTNVNETCLSGQSLYPRGSTDQIPRQTRRPPAPLHQPQIELLN